MEDWTRDHALCRAALARNLAAGDFLFAERPSADGTPVAFFRYLVRSGDELIVSATFRALTLRFTAHRFVAADRLPVDPVGFFNRVNLEPWYGRIFGNAADNLPEFSLGVPALEAEVNLDAQAALAGMSEAQEAILGGDVPKPRPQPSPPAKLQESVKRWLAESCDQSSDGQLEVSDKRGQSYTISSSLDAGMMLLRAMPSNGVRHSHAQSQAAIWRVNQMAPAGSVAWDDGAKMVTAQLALDGMVSGFSKENIGWAICTLMTHYDALHAIGSGSQEG